MRTKIALSTCISIGLPMVGLAETQTWTMTAPRAWSRTASAAKLKVGGDGALELRHVGEQDWSIHGMKPIADVSGVGYMDIVGLKRDSPRRRSPNSPLKMRQIHQRFDVA